LRFDVRRLFFNSGQQGGLLSADRIPHFQDFAALLSSRPSPSVSWPNFL